MIFRLGCQYVIHTLFIDILYERLFTIKAVRHYDYLQLGMK
jgi:hypothetical protein